MFGAFSIGMPGPAKVLRALVEMERDHLFAVAIFFGGLFLGWMATTFSQGGNSRQHSE
jgi:hypothetical protein